MPHSWNRCLIMSADGAYHGNPTYAAALQHSPTAELSFRRGSLQQNAVALGRRTEGMSHMKAIANAGRLNWQANAGYGKRAPIETASDATRG